MEPSAVSCFPRGLISLNTSVSYLIEPLPVSTGAQQHAVFRAESLHLPRGSCLHHHGNKKHEEGLDDFIRGMMSPQSVRVSWGKNDDQLSESLCKFYAKHDTIFTTYSVFYYSVFILRKKGT